MKRSRAMPSAAGGFTLLEVMVALAILGLTLVVLLRIVTNNVRATNHAKMTTAATFLARGKMLDVEDYILTNGFTDNDEKGAGVFKEQGFEKFRWESSIERVELPTDLMQKSQDEAKNSMQGAKDPMSLMSGFLGGMMSSFIEPIRIGLQESVRRVTIRVFWDEIGRQEQMVEVVQYLTDPAKLDLALTGGAAGMAGAGVPGAATPGATGAAAGSATGTGMPGTGTGAFGAMPPVRR